MKLADASSVLRLDEGARLFSNFSNYWMSKNATNFLGRSIECSSILEPRFPIYWLTETPKQKTSSMWPFRKIRLIQFFLLKNLFPVRQIRLTGNKIYFRPFPVQQPKSWTSWFLTTSLYIFLRYNNIFLSQNEFICQILWCYLGTLSNQSFLEKLHFLVIL